MRKLLLTVSALALPLAACAQEEEAPPEADPTAQEIEEPAPAPEGETAEGEALEGEAIEGAESGTEESAEEESSSEETASE